MPMVEHEILFNVFGLSSFRMTPRSPIRPRLLALALVLALGTFLTLTLLTQTTNMGTRLRPAPSVNATTFAHAINSNMALHEALSTPCSIIEADVLLDHHHVPIMAHPPDTTSDITLETFLDVISESNANVQTVLERGIKLDFKVQDALEPALELLLKKKEFNVLWLNGDVVQGPHGDVPVLSPDQFIALCMEAFPDATLSLGWTVGNGWGPAGYTEEMVENMLKV